MDAPTLIVSTLLCTRDVEMGLRCLGALSRLSDVPVSFRIHDDGSLTARDRERLLDPQVSLISAEIVDREAADEAMADALASYPACAALRNRQAYGLKLFDIPSTGSDPVVRYIDSDVLFLRPFTGLFDMREDQDCIFMQDHQNAYAMRPWHLLDPRLRLPQRINSGLFTLRRKLVDLDKIEWLLKKDFAVFQKLPWFEQTCWAWLSARHAGYVWDDEQVQVVTPTTVFDDDLVAAHFVSPVRARMKEIPADTGAGLDTVSMHKRPMSPLNPAAFMVEVAARSLRNRLI